MAISGVSCVRTLALPSDQLCPRTAASGRPAEPRHWPCPGLHALDPRVSCIWRSETHCSQVPAVSGTVRGRQRFFDLEIELYDWHRVAQLGGTLPGVWASGSSSSSGTVRGDPPPSVQAASDSLFWSLVTRGGEEHRAIEHQLCVGT